MGFRLLGPVEAWAASSPVDVGPPRQRAVVAALAADAGRLVLVDTLVNRLWGEDPANTCAPDAAHLHRQDPPDDRADGRRR